MEKTAGLELFTPLFSERYILIHFFLPGGVFNGGILKRALARGISGHDVVRPYNDIPMNALDLALNGSAGPDAIADDTSVVSQLVMAGATMAGNSKAWQRKVSGANSYEVTTGNVDVDVELSAVTAGSVNSDGEPIMTY